MRPARPDVPLVLGLGNPILTDDRVGLLVAERLHARLPEGAAALQLVHVGGLELLHVLEGYRRVVLIDSIEPGKAAPGELRRIALEDIASTYAPITPHNAGLAHCLGLGRACGLEMPEDLRIYAVGVCDPYTFSETCSQAVEAAVPRVVETVWRELFGPGGAWILQA
ncbi:MAG TPA: hydrogenase maturation protease [Myxococcota bacterium]|nr:hydrogenase maturation protease [Myxococcota bacterium]HRY95619.1 hydrogenase maturation protease [Myxococcota bacterium]HSA20123.1 hydrogenase maturation protease [Myxococcota bacterium]